MVVSGGDIGDSTGGAPSKLLGSVDAARRRGQLVNEESELDELAVVNTVVENRVLVVVDDKKVSRKHGASCVYAVLMICSSAPGVREI